MAEHNQRFETFEEWVNKASSWLTRHPEYSPAHQRDFHAICFDSKGRICRIGADFHAAIFPVYWVWPDQNLFEAIDRVRTVEMREALERLDRLFTYPVATEINPRGYDIRGTNSDSVEFAVEIIRATLAPATDATSTKNPP